MRVHPRAQLGKLDQCRPQVIVMTGERRQPDWVTIDDRPGAHDAHLTVVAESLGTFILTTDPDDMTKLGARFETY